MRRTGRGGCIALLSLSCEIMCRIEHIFRWCLLEQRFGISLFRAERQCKIEVSRFELRGIECSQTSFREL